MKVDSYDLKEIISYFKIFELCVGLQGGELWHARHNEFYAIWPDDATNETLEHLVFRARKKQKKVNEIKKTNLIFSFSSM